ncbi:MAG: phenylalanine--tRNA ligase subunit beta [Planctomycetes bacterium]|nr:phenylalanine--tRNA ligase subunit beta [Planctomycetota bacterium]
MKISLNWLKEYVAITESPQELCTLLSNIGFGIEGIEQAGDDTVIDIEITSNRGDCLCHIGIAREIAAAAGREVVLPKVNYEPVKKDIAEMVSVEIAEPNLCGRYTARIIEGVKVGPSPAWMSKRLEAIGLRSVNNVVDATNYAMMETGQPPHAFDYDKIKDGKIIVRLAKKGEKLVSIDETECKLEPDMLVITDPSGPVAIGGVMGGITTEVSSSTTSILLEDAAFEAVSIRKTSRHLNLPSEAAYRFGRGVDIEQIDWASQRTAQLIVQAAGGKIVEGVVDAYPGKTPNHRMVTMRLGRVKKVLGIDVPQQTIFEILRGLGFSPQKSETDKILCTIPTWRPDITREIDLIEEVARVYGYDKIGISQKISIEVVPVDKRQKTIEVVSGALNICGFYETITPGFCEDGIAKLVTPSTDKSHLVVQDESSRTANLLRSSLIGSLLEILGRNYNSGNKNIKIYEIANVFKKLEDGSHTEHCSLAALCDSDFQILKGAIEGGIKAVDGTIEVGFNPADVFWAKTGAEITLNGQKIGSAGVVKDKILSEMGIKAAAVCAAEINFDLLASVEKSTVRMKPLPKFPAISRALSLIVDEPIRWQRIKEIIRSKAPGELEEIKFEGIYRGRPIPTGKKSVTVSLCFRDEDGTLKHQTVDGWENAIVSTLSGAISAELRKA